GVADGARAAAGLERETAFLVGDTGVFQGIFGLPDRRHFGLGVNDAGNRVVVDVAIAGHDSLDAGDALFGRLVRQHRTGDNVTDSIDVWHVGREIVIDADAA